jgi:flagellar assembly factor FliW
MQTIQTKFFGELEYSPDSAYAFPSGLPGFEAEKSFVFVEQPAARPLMFMQSTSNTGLCFILLPILIADPCYRLQLSAEDRRALELPRVGALQIGTDILCGALVCSGDSPTGEATVNLLAPIVLNLKLQIGVQVIQTNSGYSHRHPLLPAKDSEEAVLTC